MSEQSLFPIDVVLGRSPPDRATADEHPDAYCSISITLNNPGIWFSREMTAQEFVRHYLRWFAERRFQAINIGEGGQNETIFPPTPLEIEVNDRPRLTRQGAFEEWTTHLTNYSLRPNMATDALIDSPVFCHDMEREFHRRFVDHLRQMIGYTIDNIPQYNHSHEVPLDLLGPLHLDPYIGNHRHWVGTGILRRVSANMDSTPVATTCTYVKLLLPVVPNCSSQLVVARMWLKGVFRLGLAS